MTKWATERDDLIAQTMAFVRSVTDRKPEVAVEPLPAESLRAQKPFSAPSVPSIERTAPTDAAPLPGMLPFRALPQGDMRKEIQSRVAAFQAHQHRFQREREAYFNSVLTQARSTIEGESDAPPA
jgi:hypothetical protein